MTQEKASRSGAVAFALGALALALVANSMLRPAGATHQPADKVSVGASTLEVLSSQSTPGTKDETVELMSSTLKTSSPTDLILSVTAECALWTNVATAGNDSSESIARVEVWIEIDKAIVPVSSTEPAGSTSAVDPADQGSRGRVVFCNRAMQLKTENFNDDSSDDVIKLFNRTRYANAFNWVALNLGNGVHEVKVFARLVAKLVSDGNPSEQLAKAAVGKRTLVIEPAKLANDATF